MCAVRGLEIAQGYDLDSRGKGVVGMLVVVVVMVVVVVVYVPVRVVLDPEVVDIAAPRQTA
jgi:hypothetical protein